MAEEENDIPEQDDDKKTDVDIEEGGKKKFNLSKTMLIYIGIGTLVLAILILVAVIFLGGDDEEAVDEDVAVEESLDETASAEDEFAEEPIETETEGELELPAMPAANTNTEAEQVTIEGTDDVPLDFEGDRLGAISDAVKTTGLKSNSDETTNLSDEVEDIELDVDIAEAESTADIEALLEPEPEMDELTRLRMENEALKKKLTKKEGEIIRLEYISRTNELEKQFGSSKRKFEKPLDIELNPKWGDFKDNVPNEAR